ncbi:MAG: hypothetical protein IPK82_42685 [Polyangiaceae bacterium]|nr:hypothetical protein [Polyangiaceae bacterium]
MNRSLFLFLSGACVLTAGCQSDRLVDNVDWDLDFVLTPSDQLHSPYAKGSQFGVFGYGISQDEESLYDVRSADQNILTCVDGGAAHADCQATEEGEVDLELLRDGEVVHTATVEVLQADMAWALPRAALIAANGGFVFPAPRFKVLQGGTATFQVVSMSGGKRLSGAGAITASASSELSINVEQTLLAEDRDWLQVTAEQLGEHEVQISSAGVPVSTIVIEVVDEGAVDSIELAGPSEKSAQDGETLTVVGVAKDADGETVYGVDFDWDLDGVEEPGEGDLFRYTFDKDRPRRLTAHFGDKSGGLDIHAESGFVDSTNRLGCAVSPLAPSSGLAWGFGAFGLLGLALYRRRSKTPIHGGPKK